VAERNTTVRPNRPRTRGASLRGRSGKQVRRATLRVATLIEAQTRSEGLVAAGCWPALVRADRAAAAWPRIRWSRFEQLQAANQQGEKQTAAGSQVALGRCSPGSHPDELFREQPYQGGKHPP